MTETVQRAAPEPPGGAPVPVSITVVVCAYTLDRWQDIVDALASVNSQQPPPAQLLLVVDHSPELLARARAELTGAEIIANEGPRGLSGARNTGVAHARGDVVAFLDDDATAEPGWIAGMTARYADPNVLGVGGLVIPRFVAGRPAWMPPEFDWVVGCSYVGQPTSPAPVRNFIGANMSLRKAMFDEIGLFTDGIGRVGTLPLGCEETELCIRVGNAHPDGVLLYDPAVAVRHTVPANRTTWAYFRSRCMSEGISKAAVSGLVGSDRALESERSYVRSTLPRGFVDGLRSVPTAGARDGFGRAGSVVAGLGITGAGFLRGRLRARRRR